MGDDTDVEVGQVRGAKEDSRVNRWQGAQEHPHMHGSRMLCDLVRWRTDGNRYKKHDLPSESGMRGVGWDKGLRGAIHSSRLASLWGDFL